MRKHKTTYLGMVMAMTFSAFGVPFQNMSLQQDVDTNAISAISSTADGGICIVSGKPPPDMSPTDGICFLVDEDSTINFKFPDMVLGQDMGNPLERILVNGKPLSESLQELVVQNIQDQLSGVATTGAITKAIQSMVYNPLWGKKLAVIGDSLISTPTRNTSYPAYIAQRNNMTLVHNGRSGEMLCMDRTNELGVVNNPSCLNSYTNDIPQDADFILCQIGANDIAKWADNGWNADDTDMTTNTFKGCWNLLLIGLKQNYPNAKIGMILANNWSENLGKNSEEVLQPETNGSKRQMTQWQKVQCQKLNIPVFDPVEDTRQFHYHYVLYPTNSTMT